MSQSIAHPIADSPVQPSHREQPVADKSPSTAPEGTGSSAKPSSHVPLEQSSMTTLQMLMLVAVIGLFIICGILFKRVVALETSQPSLVVVDFVALAQRYSREGASAEQVAQIMANTNRRVLELKAQGVTVLDARAVLTAPDDLYLPVEQLTASGPSASGSSAGVPALNPLSAPARTQP
ncbi:hypothetical protein [Pseudomonas sp. LTJR-52]|uniref:hypothetical protein n=1 Tax=Pseudomonas sp. LTJR-52 TaxID=2479392 RepID=UPI0013CEA2E8|nr:hypothetical protein [Pseudomonas sp. LTJR-52]